MITPQTIDWLLDGDPAIRWQAMRDLLRAPEDEWRAEQRKVGKGEDWAGRLLALQDSEGTWGGGVYSPKWKSTTYTLLTLIECGLDPSNEAAIRGAKVIFDRSLSHLTANATAKEFRSIDLCVVGFWLRIGATFLPKEERLPILIEHIERSQMEDGGWNCRFDRVRGVRHSSFHTTFNVLEGLAAASENGVAGRGVYERMRDNALEFMLQHRLYRSDKTGEIINEKFLKFSYPTRWHYDVLRGLDFMRLTPHLRDERAGDALGLLRSKQDKNGRWAAENKHGGPVFFDMERQGKNSRWNTLRGLRVLGLTC